jgi:hypothetical protein
MVAIIGIGRTTPARCSISEDTDLLRAVGLCCGSVTTACCIDGDGEAEELARLKESSGNIIESVNVGFWWLTRWSTYAEQRLEEVLGIARGGHCGGALTMLTAI